jgi:hypothetical protein
MTHRENEGKACPVVARACLQAGCMAWDEPGGGCRLIPSTKEAASTFDARLRQVAPLMYGSLLDLVRVMEERARLCDACGADPMDGAMGGAFLTISLRTRPG